MVDTNERLRQNLLLNEIFSTADTIILIYYYKRDSNIYYYSISLILSSSICKIFDLTDTSIELYV